MDDRTDTSASDSVERVDLTPSEWYRLVNPLRYVITFLLFELCKYLLPRAKAPLYRAFGADIGERATVSPHVLVDPFFPGKVSIGDDSIVG